MLDDVTKKRINTLRQILVGKLPDPKAQVEQITNGLIYKFMNDMDEQSVSMGGKSTYFSGKFQKYSWKNLMDTKTSGVEKIKLYSEAIEQMYTNENLPELFREIFKNSFLPFKDPSTLNMFLKEINEFHYSNSEKLGDAFEYLLSFMGSQGDAGQFRTPRHIIDFITEIVNPQKNETVLDPACGTAGFLISAYKHILKQNTKKNLGDGLNASDRKKIGENLNGYDISPDMVKMSLVNMYLHKFTNPKINEYDTLSSEDRWNEYYDVILANPPFFSPKGGIMPHNRFGVKSTKAEILFIDYINEHLKPNGRAGIIVPEGVIFQSGTAYKQLRKKLIETSLVGVISLPAGIFQPYSGVKTSVLILDKKISKQKNKVFFLEIKNDGYAITSKRNKTDLNDLPKAIEDIGKFKENKTFLIINKSELISNEDYVLTINSYKLSKPTNSKCETEKLSNIVVSMHQGLNTAGEKVKFVSKGIPVLQTRNITSGKIDFKNMKYVDENTYKKYSSKFTITKNDILLANIGTIGKSLIVKSEDVVERVLIHWNIFKIQLNPDKINHRYFNYYLNYLDRIKYFLQFQKGGTVNFISKKFLNELEIPLPPLETQNQIVEELDGYQKIIDGCRQVIENYKPLIDIDPSWEMVELNQVCYFKRGPFGGSLKKEIFKNEGYLVYEQYHAINDDYSKERYFIDNKKFEEMKGFAVKENDLIISCSGTMGKVSIIPENFKKGIINQALLKLTPDEKLVNSYFLKFYLQSAPIQIKYFTNQSGSAIQNVASVKVLKKIPFPSVNLNLQNQIVKKIKEEINIIEFNKKLIEIYKSKTEITINKLWSK